MIKNKYHHGNLKEELIDIAFKYIKENDVESLTLKILGDSTGTSRSAIYRHFKSKNDLIETIITKGFEYFDDCVSPALHDNEVPLIDRFYLSGKRIIKFANENPNLYRLLFGKNYAHIREEIIDLKDENCSGLGALKTTLEEGQALGMIQEGDSYQMAIVIWASLHGLASLIIDGFMDVEKLADELYDNMFKYLLNGIVSNKIKFISSLPFSDRILPQKLKK
ncbi:TetR/AcrR family transcriptional regulator [Sulfurovum sp. zt1-1]|uniref:TetR/AcrR family transcriptional regulator n=2 Tax=Sulfurovum zhangzhouensis TaxID=3019067 RepID=A0ABT7QX72_9BACT|nr:TetR/AcrR family transcriptional regulator [Sulfurovum zhangzhouensis]